MLRVWLHPCYFETSVRKVWVYAHPQCPPPLPPIPQLRGLLGQHRWLHNQFPPFFSVLHCPLSLCLARRFWPGLMNGRHIHTISVCFSLWWTGCLHVVQLPGSLWQNPAGNRQLDPQGMGRHIYWNALMKTMGVWTPLKNSVQVSQQCTAKAKGVCFTKGSLYWITQAGYRSQGHLSILLCLSTAWTPNWSTFLLLRDCFTPVPMQAYLFFRCWILPMHLKVPLTMMARRPHSASHSSMLQRRQENDFVHKWWYTIKGQSKNPFS